MSISGFFSDFKTAATKVVTFIVHQMTFAEELLGSNTGNEKLNLVIKAVEGALAILGVDTSKVQEELKAVVDALVALFNKAGIFPANTQPPTTPAP